MRNVTHSAALLLILVSAGVAANPDKARTQYNKCLAELGTEQRKIDQVMRPAKSRCDNTGVCIEVSIGASVGGALSRMDAFEKGQDCMLRLDEYESACEEAGKECEFKTFDEAYNDQWK
jgi:hypothetical protein